MNIFDQQLHNSLSSVRLHQELDRQFNGLLNGQDSLNPARLMLIGIQDGILTEDEAYDYFLSELERRLIAIYKGSSKETLTTINNELIKYMKYAVKDKDKEEFTAGVKKTIAAAKNYVSNKRNKNNLTELVEQYKILYKSNLRDITKKMLEGSLLKRGINLQTPQGRNMQKVLLALYDTLVNKINNWSPQLGHQGDDKFYNVNKSSYYN